MANGVSRAWEGFNPGEWNEKVNVSDFIKRNYTEYTGDSSFLSGATERTKELMEKFSKLLDKERENGGVCRSIPKPFHLSSPMRPVILTRKRSLSWVFRPTAPCAEV